MTILIIILHVVVCFMLIGVILLQAGRGQGLTGANFGGNVQSLFGTKGSIFLQKATTVSAIFFMITCISLSVIETQKSRSLLEGGRTSAPIDIDQIQRALEKVKGEAALNDQGVPDASPEDIIDRAGEQIIAGDAPEPLLPGTPGAVPAIPESPAALTGAEASPNLQAADQPADSTATAVESDAEPKAA